MNKLHLKPTDNPTDFTHRQYFKDANNRLYCVEPNEKNELMFSLATKEGEPDSILPAYYTLFINGEPKWRTSANRRGLLEPAEVNLEDACNGDYTLTEEDKVSLLNLLGKRLRAKRYNRLKQFLDYIHYQNACTLYQRVYKRIDRDGWEICARQDYDYDLKCIRDALIGQ